MGLGTIGDRLEVSGAGFAVPAAASHPAWKVIVNVLASLLIMCCSGSVYAWSIFVTPLRAEYGLTTGDTQLIFGAIIACFSITMLFVARIERRLGPSLTAAIGAVLFGAGYLVASFSDGSVWLLLAGIGVLSGAGMGFGYVTVLTTLVKWFPGRQGLATGIAVAGFGSGAILLSWMVRPFLDDGLAVTEIFRYIGVIYSVLFMAGALFISAPAAQSEAPVERPITYAALARDRRFWVLFYTFFAGSFAGLMLIGNLKPMGIFYGIGEGAAVMAIVMVSVGNAAGRVLWGQVYDKIGGRRSVGVALALLATLMLALVTGISLDITFLLLCLFIGLSYGANFVLYASEVAHIYGIPQLGVVYPVVSVAYGISGILGPLAGGYIYDATGQYFIPVVLSCVICLTGLFTFVLAGRQARTAV
jgi:MFS transporter, OFA family, oxalate/formate antiporter